MSAQPVSFFGEMLRRYRAAADLSQEELAERARLSVRAISDLERGVKRSPRKDTVELLANALALSPQKRALFTATARPGLTLAAPQPLRSVAGDLATPLTPLIGREHELLAVVRLLARAGVRLITFTGPGGVGKTRLVLHLAEELRDDFDDGVYLVSLAPVRNASQGMAAVARALGLREEPGELSLRQVSDHLRERQTMLILDNMEHLLGMTPDVSALLLACPRLKVMITSRQPLRIRGEQELPVAPLSIEAAMQLFLDRVHAVQPMLTVAATENDIARTICVRLDCLPLALELAAVRARTLSLPLLLQRLDSALTLLTVGWRDLPERQQTLRSAIAWSVDALDEDERRVFRWLGVFSGGCSLPAAYAVCAQADEEANALFDTLAGLAEKSLLQLDPSEDDTPRFLMLETIREYAIEMLRETKEERRARALHAAYYAEHAEQAHPEQAQKLQRDMDNLRAALAWAIQTRQSALGLRIGACLARMWYMHGYANEGEEWLRALLDLDASSAERATPQLRLEALYAAGRFAMDRRDFTRARALADESLTLARQSASLSGMANALATLGHVAEAEAGYDDALVYFEESLALSRQADDIDASGRAVSSLGNLARMRGDYEQATSYLEDSLRIARTLNLTWGIFNALTSLGHVVCEQGAYDRAAAYYRDSLELSDDFSNEVNVAWLLEGIVVVITARGDHEQAARLCAAIAQLRHEDVAATGENIWAPYAQAVEACRDALGEVAWQRAITTEITVSPSASAAYALDLLR
jgi:predicted ATPase/DNA-binding XRE family transcriptional regulator